MDLVLGLSMTSADVRWVLVEGTTAEGATICRDAVDFDTLDDVIAAVGDNRLHPIGVTWANEAESAASTLLDALAARGLDNAITNRRPPSRWRWVLPIGAVKATLRCASSNPTTLVIGFTSGQSTHIIEVMRRLEYT